MPDFVKRRLRPAAGSIPEALDMFGAEVRFYREIAPVLGVRVPNCYAAEQTADGTRLVLEDLSDWRPGADPVAVARLLAELHRRWAGVAPARWPWLRRVGAAADLIGALYDQVWPQLAERRDISPRVRAFGQRLVGRVADAERAGISGASLTLVHGDVSARNLRTGPDGEIAFLDWEDVSIAAGVTDLVWMLISSVPPGRWGEVRAAYGPVDGFADAIPAAVAQALLSLADSGDGSVDAAGWMSRIEAADQCLS